MWSTTITMIRLFAAFSILFSCLPSGFLAAEEKATEKPLPRLPWHMADIWWHFDKPTENFESLEVDVTIDRDVPETVCLYISPCGLARINGINFYGGLQTSINGWPNRTDKTKVYLGKGAIFSRWSHDKKTPIGLEHVRTAAEDCLLESAGYEGEFASVRRPYAWTKGTYTYCIKKAETITVDGADHTWFTCSVRDSKGKSHEIGSLRFEGKNFTFWEHHSAFVEIYSTNKIRQSEVPQLTVTFGYPRINGKAPALKSARVIHPTGKERSASPDVCRVTTEKSHVIATIGPVFARDAKDYRHDLPLQAPVEKK